MAVRMAVRNNRTAALRYAIIMETSDDATLTRGGGGTAAPGPFAHSGRVGELLPIVLKNAVLNILTLSIYRFWAKTAVRRYLWSRSSLLEVPLEYTGSGAELFLGFLIVILVIFLPYAVIDGVATFFLSGEAPSLYDAYTVLVALAALALTGVALYRARRYRLSRTNWRGIRSALTGSPWRYGAIYAGYLLLDLVTLGWSYPWTKMKLIGRITDEMWFGDRQFRFAGGAGPLYGRFAFVWLVSVGTFAITIAATIFLTPVGYSRLLVALYAVDNASLTPEAWIRLLEFLTLPMLLTASVGSGLVTWYKALELQQIAKATKVSDLSFKLGFSFAQFVRLLAGNTLIVLLTLGAGAAFAQMRKARFLCRHLEVHGAVDLESVLQSVGPLPGRGEGLADAFDVGDF